MTYFHLGTVPALRNAADDTAPDVPETRVVVGYLHGPDTAAGFTKSLWNLLAHDVAHNRYLRGAIAHYAGPNLSTPRNEVVRRFLQTDCTHLFFVDSDMTFGKDTVDRLLEVDAPIVSGLCFGQRIHVAGGLSFFTVMFRRDDNGFYRVDDYPPDTVIDVDAVGAACLLIRRDVLEDLHDHHPDPWPWFAEEQSGEVVYGEDVTFCLRARDAGWPVKVHTGVKTGHMKAHEVTEDTYRAWRASSGE